MAIFHCQAKPISRSAGRSATGAAAYRAGEKLKDERTGAVHDYTRKQGVECAELVFPSGVSMSREELWNLAERAEKRKDARVAREWEIALPAELPKEQRRELALDFAKYLVEQYGVAADVAIHAPSSRGDERNFHAHILITTRQSTAQGLGAKTDLELEDKALRAQRKKTGRKQIEAIRARWASLVNMTLLANRIDERVSHKSLKAQGIDREPTQHLGVAATAMERRGVRSERGDLNRHCVERQQDKAELELLGQEQRDEEKRQEAEAELAKVMRERLLQKAKRLFSTEERETPEPKPAPRPVRTVKVIDDEDEKDKKESHAAWEARRRKESPDLWKTYDKAFQQYKKLEESGWTETKSEDEERRCRRKREKAEESLQGFKAEAKGLGGFLKCLFQREERQARERQLLDALAKAKAEEEKAKAEYERGKALKEWLRGFDFRCLTEWEDSPEYRAFKKRQEKRVAEKWQIWAREEKLTPKKKRGVSL